MAYSKFKLIRKTTVRDRSSRTGTAGAPPGNINALKHGGYAATGLELLNRTSRLYKHLSRWRTNVIDDLGGEENLSELELTLIRRALYLEQKLILFETQQEGETSKDTDTVYISWANTQRLTIEKLGLKRRKRETKLSDYLKGQAG